MCSIELKKEGRAGVEIFIDKNKFADMNKELSKLTPELRSPIIHKVQEDIIYTYPTMANREIYLSLRTETEIKEDFDLTIRGEILDSENYIIKGGGIGGRYRESVEKNAEMNHWRSFWEKVSYAETNGIEFPDMDMNLDHITWYAFHYLPITDAMRYLKSIRLRLLVTSDKYTKLTKEYVDKEVKQLIDKLKDILE